MTSVAEGLRKGRSHLIIAAALAIGGTLVVQIEDRTLNREAGKAIPKHEIAPPGGLPTMAVPAVRVPVVAVPAAANTQAATPATPPMPAPAPRPPSPAPQQAPRGPAIQLGAFDSAAVAQERWAGYARRVPELAALDHSVETASTPRGTVYRLLAGVPDRAAAREACAAVRHAGGACFVR